MEKLIFIGISLFTSQGSHINPFYTNLWIHYTGDINVSHYHLNQVNLQQVSCEKLSIKVVCLSMRSNSRGLQKAINQKRLRPRNTHGVSIAVFLHHK